MFGKHSEHTELKRQQQRSLAGYCSNPYVRDQANCNWLRIKTLQDLQSALFCPPVAFFRQNYDIAPLLYWQRESENVSVPGLLKSAFKLLAHFLQRFSWVFAWCGSPWASGCSHRPAAWQSWARVEPSHCANQPTPHSQLHLMETNRSGVAMQHIIIIIWVFYCTSPHRLERHRGSR